MPETREHPNPVAWYALKDEVKYRWLLLCEYCQWRHGIALHHRHYRTWGCEQPEDVMLICGPCHQLIGGHRSWDLPITFRPDSLLALGDTGMDSTPTWQAYLLASAGSAERRERAAFVAQRRYEEMLQRLSNNPALLAALTRTLHA